MTIYIRMCLNHSRQVEPIFASPPHPTPCLWQSECAQLVQPGKTGTQQGASANPCSLPIVVTFPPIATILPPLGPVWWIIQTGPTVIALPLPSPLSGSSYLTIGVTVWTQRVDGGWVARDEIHFWTIGWEIKCLAERLNWLQLFGFFFSDWIRSHLSPSEHSLLDWIFFVVNWKVFNENPATIKS